MVCTNGVNAVSWCAVCAIKWKPSWVFHTCKARIKWFEIGNYKPVFTCSELETALP